MDVGGAEVVAVVVTVVALLVALGIVLAARRAAAGVRERAAADAARIGDDTRRAAAELERRADGIAARERALADDRAAAADLAQSLRDRALALADSERRTAQELAAERAALAADRAAASAERQEALTARSAAVAELESIAGLTRAQARAEVERRVVEQATHEAETAARRAEARVRAEADERARRIVATAVQRLAGPTSSQSVVAHVRLPTEEMKGRIIGKEGRNIRAFEALTGVNVLIDDTPDAVVLSCFDAERREVAHVALEALMADGRINPQRIETAYTDAVAGADERAMAAGHLAAEQAGVGPLHRDLVHTMGRLRLRTSYGQNVLAHLVETAQIAAVMAAEVGADVAVARRAAFLHDVGKALTPEVAGTHAAIGADLARRCGEGDVVVNAIAAHHDEVTPESVEAVLVQAADACSAARPGARREELDQYVERMDTIERLVAEHEGVRRVLAMSAGREVRVIVQPEVVDDYSMPGLATAIARHIEADLTYPGEIKVTVIREIRASATAG
ncbi:ribonuclease Y [Cellulomonas sp. ATA003]|uniref:ribonuclease Y n=1 Tax=Cellulomonas sp. ATA003 TaxID=3073064 RepID=UPI0028738BB5|nr:ribonuclease Y [Cellulomonas sp. ATA003]WNB84881.1 ribonuclease Y [Cellulomonas sp. ATA003]